MTEEEDASPACTAVDVLGLEATCFFLTLTNVLP